MRFVLKRYLVDFFCIYDIIGERNALFSILKYKGVVFFRRFLRSGGRFENFRRNYTKKGFLSEIVLLFVYGFIWKESFRVKVSIYIVCCVGS